MTHTIRRSKHKTTTPTGLYEANYRRFIRLIPELGQLVVRKKYQLALSKIQIQIIEQHKYTTVLSFKQALLSPMTATNDQALHASFLLNSIDMELRICHDACLVEVIGYQGKSPIQSSYVYPNKHMIQVDEKRQLNLFLKDVLESSLKTELSRQSSITPCN